MKTDEQLKAIAFDKFLDAAAKDNASMDNIYMKQSAVTLKAFFASEYFDAKNHNPFTIDDVKVIMGSSYKA
jgi:hypothetical protein